MSRELTTANHVAPPAPLAGRVVGRLDDMFAAIRYERGRYVIDARHAPDAEQRAWLQGRVAAIDAALSPLGKRNAEYEWARLSTALRPPSYANEGAARLAAHEAVKALEGLPAFAVVSAVDEFCAGIGWPKGFAPESSIVADRARSKAAPLHAERAKIARILSAEVITRAPVSPEMRERLAAQARELAASMRAEAVCRDVAAGLVSSAPPPPETPDAALSRLAAEMRAAPLTATAELIATWGKS